MQTDIDWSKAPEGATHYNKSIERFYKVENGTYVYLYSCNDDGWLPSAHSGSELNHKRFTKRPPEWNGEGLPPSGTVCDMYRYNCWSGCEVIGVHGDFAIVYHNGDYITADSNYLRPIKSERERVIDEMHEAYFEGARGHIGGIAGIYEAGFRKAQS